MCLHISKEKSNIAQKRLWKRLELKVMKVLFVLIIITKLIYFV